MRRLASLLAVIVVAMLPASAGAQSLLGTPQIGTPTVTATAPPDTSSVAPSTGLSTFDEVLIFVGGIGLIVIIAVIILRDAHRRAPATEESLREWTAGPKRPADVQKRRRAKARHVRQQRKKNRPGR
jgi:hypothetical protein